MTPDDTLRDLLHGEAAAVVPGGTFGDVVHRARRRRARTRHVRLAVVAVAAAAVVAIAVPLAAMRDGGSEEVDTVSSPTVPGDPDGEDPAPTVEPAPTEDPDGGGQPTSIPTPTPDPTAVAGIFPFASALEAQEWPGPDADGHDYRDPRVVATAFLEEVGASNLTLGEPQTLDGALSNLIITATEPRTGVTTNLELAQLGGADAWTVIGAHADRLRLSEPSAGAMVTGPVTVRGEVSSFEGTVLVEVRTRATGAEPAGFEPAIGGSGPDLGPFEIAVDLAPEAAGPGYVLASTTSAFDGAVEQIAAVPVVVTADPGPDAPTQLPTGAPLSTDEAVVVLQEDGEEFTVERLVVIDLATGAEVRTLLDGVDTVEGGVLDVTIAPDRRSVLVAVSTSACTSEIRALAADGSSGSETVGFGSGDRVAISRDGRNLAIAVDPECDGTFQLVVRSLVDGTETVFGGEIGLPAAGLDADGSEGLPAVVAAVTWIDEDTVAYVVRYEDGTGLFTVSIVDGTSSRLRSDELDIEWAGLGAHPDGGILAVRTCCVGAPSSSQIVVVDPVTDEIEVLHPLPEGSVATRARVSSDRSGVLWLSDTGELTTNGGETPVVDGVVAFDS